MLWSGDLEPLLLKVSGHNMTPRTSECSGPAWIHCAKDKRTLIDPKHHDMPGK